MVSIERETTMILNRATSVLKGTIKIPTAKPRAFLACQESLATRRAYWNATSALSAR